MPILGSELKVWRNQLQRGTPRSASVQCKVSQLSTVQNNLNTLLTDLSRIEPDLGRGNLSQLPIKDLEELFNNLAADLNSPLLVARLLEIEREIEQCGAKTIISDIRRLKPAPYLWARQFSMVCLVPRPSPCPRFSPNCVPQRDSRTVNRGIL